MSTNINTEALYVTMQVGITGGFAPPIPKALSIVKREPGSQIFTIATQSRPHGTPNLQDPVTRELSVAEHAASIARLQELLAELPTQYPGAEDLYGLDTSIVHVTEEARLHELGRYGSAAAMGLSSRPTEEQKALFSEAVAIIQKWGSA